MRSAFFALLIFPTVAMAQPEAQDPTKATTEKFESLFRYISRLYVDSVDGEKIVERAIVSMLEELDPHSVYIPAKELKKMNEPLKGNFEGIGIRFNILKDTIFVVNPIPGGPSEKLGIRAGDKIIKVEDETVAGIGITNSGVGERLRGKKGTRVNVSILRRGEDDLLQYEIVRNKIPIYSLDASYMIAPETGYIKINRFSATTMDEFHQAMSDLQMQGMENLILDLQGNGGGYLKTAINLSDEFLSGNKLIVYTEGRAYAKDETYARKEGSFEKGKLVVLVDQSSASASEIVSGAIQDWDRGLIVGRRSFGKGLVQRPITLPDGSAVRLTISRYYTPSGRCIQKPYEEGKDAYHAEKYARLASGELMHADSIDLPDSLKYFTNNERIVYGGGGIMPDVFVPLDTSHTSKYFSALIRKGITNTYSLTYVDKNRKKLKSKYKNALDFKANFEVSDSMMKDFLAQAEEEGIEMNEEEYARSEYAIRLRLKALIGQNFLERGAFYVVINDINESLQRALEVLEDDTFEKMKLAEN